MHYNKKLNDLMQNEIIDKNSLNCALLTNAKENDTENVSNSKTTLIIDVDDNRKTIKVHETPDIETNTATTKSTSCTSSTDSGVNISDNDEIPPSPTSSQLHSFPSLTSSSCDTSLTTTINPLYKQFQKNNKKTKQDNNIKNDNGIKHNNNHTFNYDEEYDNVKKEQNSTNSDNELKNEQQQNRRQLPQQLSKVENRSGNENNNTQLQTNQNVIDSVEHVINVSHQRKSTITPTPTNSNIPLLQHNEFIHLPQRSASTSSSLSMPSSTISNDINPPSKMHHCNNGSPVVSIRSINSTIITSDSDSDLNSDSEEGNENYVIKKLGTQVTYPPKHPDIPNLNSGHTVLNQKVVPNDDLVAASSLATLAAVADSIGTAQALGPVPSFSAVPQRPQIGSIALSNSSDVTFGDKHFYEGPVTIQQFLIDGRDKSKENGYENPSFVNDNTGTTTNAKDINPSAEESGKLYDYILKRKKIIIPGLLVVVLLLVAAIFGFKALNSNKSKLVLGSSEESRDNIPINSTIDTNDECSGNGTFCIIERDVWRAHPQKTNLDKQNLPLSRVIISHTASSGCDTLLSCIQIVRSIQEFHQNSLGWDDIGYNFLISSDGSIYVGRGWDDVGAHTKGYNTNSVGISFIGTYIATKPTEAQVKACLALIEEGIRLKKLVPNYRLYGARQLGSTESPGNMLYNVIKKWPHWSADIKLT